VRSASAISARSAADSGLTMALFEMNERYGTEAWDENNLPEGTESLPHCDSAFTYTVSRDAAGYVIESTGTNRGTAKTVACTLEFRGPFEYAIFGESRVNLKNSAKVDWYNYDDDDPPMQIGTNSTKKGAVTLKKSATVNGNVVIGVGGDPDVAVSNSGEITGDIRVSPEENPIPLITVPEWLERLPSSGTMKDSITLSSSAKYKRIDLKNGNTMKVNDDVSIYVTGDITLGNSVEIEIADDASLILYLGGDFESKNSVQINVETKDAKKLQMVGLDSCKDIDFKNSSEMYGTIYAPKADVVMHNSNKTWGAIVSKKLEFKNSGELYYDASLREYKPDNSPVRFVMTNWHER
ncbi:MAG: DUF7305 domain-containing protein, partial [Planctomycetota bacterium]